MTRLGIAALAIIGLSACATVPNTPQTNSASTSAEVSCVLTAQNFETLKADFLAFTATDLKTRFSDGSDIKLDRFAATLKTGVVTKPFGEPMPYWEMTPLEPCTSVAGQDVGSPTSPAFERMTFVWKTWAFPEFQALTGATGGAETLYDYPTQTPES